MTDRVESAERLLATLELGRAHLRALARDHLGPARALSMELRAAGLASGRPTPRARTTRLVPPTVVEAAVLAPAASTTIAMDSPPVEPLAGELAAPARVASTDAPTQSAAEPAARAPADVGEDPTELPAAGHGQELPAETPAPPAHRSGDTLEEATQLLRVDDDLRAATDAPRPSVQLVPPEAYRAEFIAAEDSREQAVFDEDTSDEDTDPGAILSPMAAIELDTADPAPDFESATEPSAALAADLESFEDPPFEALAHVSGADEDAQSVPLEAVRAPSADEEPSASFEQTLIQESPLIDEADSASFEQTLLDGSIDIFGDQLDPTAGWNLDDEEAIVDEGVVGGLSWGDDGDEPIVDPFQLQATDESPAPPAPMVEPEDERTRIATADAALIDAIQAANAPAVESEDDDDFELSADQLQWGDAQGELRHDSLSIALDTPEPEGDDLHWGDDSSTSWAVEDLPGAGLESAGTLGEDFPSEDLDVEPDDENLLFSTAGAPSDEGPEDDLLPRVASWADEPVDQAPTDATAAVSTLDAIEPEPEPDIVDLPDVLEEDSHDLPETPVPIVRAPEVERRSEPVPILAIPRVVEPRSSDSLSEPTGAAAIQILGVGRAQTLTPTLELGGADDEPDASSLPAPRGRDGDSDSDGFSLQFEEPEEASTGPHIPVLTEDVALPHQPAVLSPDGVVVSSASRSGRAGLSVSEAERFLGLARAAEQKGNLRDAVVHYDDLLSHDPHNLTGHLGRGRCLVDLGDYGSAMSDFTRAEDIAPDSPEPLVEMGNLFFARKEYKRAITYYNHALDLDNRHAMAFSRRGISHYHRKMFAEAHNDLLEAERQDPSIPGLQRYIQVTSRKLKKRR